MSKTKKTKTSSTGITKKASSKGPLKTRIAIVMDCSGSMGSIRNEAIAMYNEQIKTIKRAAKGIDTKVTFVTFSTTPNKPLIFNESVEKLKPLTPEDYIPNGWTAMYDAVGQTVDAFSSLKEFKDPNCSFLFIILSDGQENYSREFTADGISGRIKMLQNGGRWTFTYLGANQDLSTVSRTLNIPIGNTHTWLTTAPGAYAASVVNSTSTEAYLKGVSSGVLSSANFYNPENGGGAGGTTGTIISTTTDSKETK
jgi:hypothetical protein